MKDRMKKLPNFFIVGAAKAGTTSIYNYLDQHSDVYMSPIKEPHYFSKDIQHKDFNKSYLKNTFFSLDDYLSKHELEKKHIAFIDNESQYLQLYRDVKHEKKIGEISNGYLYSKVAAEEIYKFNPKAKIVIVLRDPIDRAFSHWMMDLQGEDVCRKSFIDAITKDQTKEDKGWGKSHLYVELGLYHDQVKRFQDIFPEEQILIMLYDDLKNNQVNFFNEMFCFLNIESISINQNKHYNVSLIPKYPLVNSIIRSLRLNQYIGIILPKTIKQKIKKLLLNNNDLPILTIYEKAQVMSYFTEEINKLEKLINRNLSMWLKN